MSSEPHGSPDSSNTNDGTTHQIKAKSLWEAQGRGISGLVIVITGLAGRLVVAAMPGTTDLLANNYSTTKETVGMITLIIIVVGTIFSGAAVTSKNGTAQGVWGLVLGGGFLLYKAFQIGRFMG